MVRGEKGRYAMRRDTVSGIVLMAGAVAGIVVMGLHPTMHRHMSPEAYDATVRLSWFVHGLALTATPLVFLGMLGVARRLGGSDLAIAGLVAVGVGGVAVMLAAVANGFVVPGVLARIVAAEGSNIPHAFVAYTGLWNQAFAKVHLVAYSVGVLLWSAAILAARDRLAFARFAGVIGLLIGLGTLLAFATGQFQLDVHGSRLVAFPRSAWMIGLGILLCLPRRVPTPPAEGSIP